jgi:hypothetical protein
MTKQELLEMRGLTTAEIDYVLNDGEPTFNPFVKPVSDGPDKVSLILLPREHIYMLVKGTVYKQVKTNDYAVMWTANSHYDRIKNATPNLRHCP